MLATILLMLITTQVSGRQVGTVTGTLRDDLGFPVPGVRIAAIPRPINEAVAADAAMVAIAQTDAEGRFKLENIPPGRYVVAAGRLDLQTYFPGTQSLADATVLSITSAAAVQNIDFVLNNTSAGRESRGSPAALRRISATSIPVTVKIVGGELTVVRNGIATNIVLTSPSNEIRIPIDARVLYVPGGVSEVFRVKIENLPDRYEVETIRYGTTDITSGPLRLDQARSGISIVIRAAP